MKLSGRDICAWMAAVTVALTFGVGPVRADGAEVTVHVAGLESTEGDIIVALFDEAGWKGKERIVAARIAADAADLTLKLAAPAPGKYGIKAFHDLDKNGEMNKTFGIPTEPYAFSNDAKASGGPPDFSAAAFDVTADGAEQTIQLR
ncbi:MAG: DUF2141 domain-containing protein [Parvibaculum sp.]|nr:DUF2141 domain-containing protein [Parvibaculum sp.]|tara:strand:+ start:4398 stop:4838 length:441 start_codon:yes stop_codon:yes gene_type:complete